VAGLVWALLSERRRLPHSVKYADLIQGVSASVAAEGPAMSVDDPVAVWKTYDRRGWALDARLGSHGDLIFRNYCQHYLRRNPYTDCRSLLEAMYRLGVHLAAVRLLVVLHPEIALRLSAAPDRRRDREVFDRVAVEVIQTFSKAIAHHPDYLEAVLRQRASEVGGFTFGQLVLLAKFV
jgi:hypothetical protein